MPHTEKQNPNNKVGRNSGAGPGGVTEIVPTEREAERGLQPLSTGAQPAAAAAAGWGRAVGYGVGVLALIGGGVAAMRVRQRRNRTLRARIERLIPWKR